MRVHLQTPTEGAGPLGEDHWSVQEGPVDGCLHRITPDDLSTTQGHQTSYCARTIENDKSWAAIKYDQLYVVIVRAVLHVFLNGMPKSHEILMFWLSASTMSTIQLCGITALFGIFLETNKHQNLMRLRHPI